MQSATSWQRRYFTYLQFSIFNLIWGVCTNKNRRQIQICTIREALKVHTLQSTIWYKGTFAALLAHSSHHWNHAFIFEEFPVEPLKVWKKPKNSSSKHCKTSAEMRTHLHAQLVSCLFAYFYSISTLSTAQVGSVHPCYKRHAFSQWDGSAKFCFSATLRHILPHIPW